MAPRKSYGQFCGLARSLDRVGDRWTLLIVRELLLGPRTYRQVQEGLAGISPSLLSQRMSDLIADGLVERNEAPPRSKAVVYNLTGAGRELEPAVLELIRWGSRWMASGPEDDRADPSWSTLALKALLDGPSDCGRGVVHLDIEGTGITVRASGGRRVVSAGCRGVADAVVVAEMPAVLAAAAGLGPLDPKATDVAGDLNRARAILDGSL